MTDVPSGGWREVYEEYSVPLCCHEHVQSVAELEESGERFVEPTGMGECG